MSINPPKGTRDFYPPEMATRNFIAETWKNCARRFGFEEYDGPIFEHLDLFTKKSGDEIVGQLYNFTDKGNREIALRPELTPTLARMVNQKGPSLRYPLKWFSIPRLFRYERMQKGRLREFFQLNLDILGIEDVSADAEIIAAVVEMLRAFHLNENDFCVKVNDRNLLQSGLESIGIPAEKIPKILSVMDKQAKTSTSEYADLLKNESITSVQIDHILKLKETRNLSEFRDAFPQLPSSAQENLTSLQVLFKQYGIQDYCLFDPGIVRGLAYYTGVVFEVYYKGETMRAIAGGGRYDHLTESLGGKPCAATGFGIGDVVLENILKQKNLIPEYTQNLDCFLIFIGEKARNSTPALATMLRRNGFSANFSMKNEKMNRQFKRADDMNSKFALILGDQEIEQKVIRIKVMGSGDEISVPVSNVIESLQNLTVKYEAAV